MGISTERLEMVFEIASEVTPEVLKVAMPRRYAVPTGFLNPRFNSALLCSFFMENHVQGSATDMTVVLDRAIAYRLFDHLVPTYFVAEPFLRAVLATEPPKDFKLTELFWPMEAMVLVLPLNFMREYVGHDIPFLLVSKLEQGEVRCKALPVVEGVEVPVPKIAFSWQVFQNGSHFDYAGSFPLTYDIASIVGTDIFTDYTLDYKKELFDRIAPEREPGLTREQDMELANKMYSLGVKLMLAMTARPQMIETGTCVRPAKIKHGRLRSELWSPNMIGARYQVLRAKTEHQGGTHASPCLHWRRGHYRYQKYGPGLTLRKLIPIDPVLVGATEE